MIIGREAEILAMERLVGGARIAQSGVLVVEGEAGIGKTSLLDHVAATATSVRVLRARGTASEQDVGFAALHQLLLPLLPMIHDLPAPQAEALGTAFALRRGAAPTRFAVAAATLGLVSLCAEDEPLLLVVDDAHRLDRPSAEAVVFTCRRLMADPVAVLLASRPVPGTPVVDAGLPAITLTGLGTEEVARMLGKGTRPLLAREAAAAVHAATAGNPLAVAELAGHVDRVLDRAPPTPVEVPGRLRDEFSRRLASLDDATRMAMLVTAISEDDGLVVTHALAGLGISVGELAAAEAVGLVRLEAGRFEFRHPLVRSSVYATASAAERRTAHRAVADAQPDTEPDRRAWHLAEATTGADAALAADLAEVGRRAAARGAQSVAATAHERAARLAVTARRRARHLLDAGEAAWLAGQFERAGTLLDEARSGTPDTQLQAAVDGVRGNLEMSAGSMVRARTFLQRAVAASEEDPDRAAVLAADLLDACFYLGATADALAAADRLEALLSATTSSYAALRGRMMVGCARVLAGRDGIDLIRSALTTVESAADWDDDEHRPAWMVLGSLFLRESGIGRDVIEHVVQEVRTRCALGTLPNLLFLTARDDATTDRWDAARAGYSEAIALAREGDRTTDLTMCLAGRAWLSARTGAEPEALADADEAEGLARANDLRVARAWVLFARGDLELGAGRVAAALAAFEELDAALSDLGLLDVDLAPGPEVVDALVRLGRVDEAAPRAATYHRRALAKGQPWAIARAERALALVAAPGAAVGHFEAALAQHRLSLDCFETARTQLAYGAWQRRARRRVAARPLLREGLATFERIGARPWAEQAAAELLATGERPHRRGDRSIDLLTPQEAQIAGLLGAGRTTRQAAVALFLSPKTVEYHLRHIYTKLGVHSRSELAAAMSDSR